MTDQAIPIVQGLRAFVGAEDGDVRRCKIVATLGPASSSEEVIRELIEAGMDVARLNFSHGDHKQHQANIDLIRRLSRESGRNVAILQDLQGPKIRCGQLIEGHQRLERGETYDLTYGHEQTDRGVIPIDYRHLIRDVKAGERVMMDDGLILLTIEEIAGESVRVRVDEGGILKNRKGINFPDSGLSIPAVTEKDSADLIFGIANNVDVIALSFVQRPEDVTHCRKIIGALGNDTPIIAKIEKLSAVDRIEEIADAADALMVARGDLGVEGSVEKVPVFQRAILDAAGRRAKPVVIATQMLESMMQSPEPTQAEATDVANAVLEGADCVMLSGEVAAGAYPVRCVQKMASIIRRVESWPQRREARYRWWTPKTEKWQNHTAIARAACEAADNLGARALVCLTLTGSIARLIASWRPRTPVIAISPRHDVIQRLSYTWGVHGMRNPLFYDTDILLQDLPQLLKSLSIVQSGDVIVITAAIPLKEMNPTNMLKINRIP